MTFSTILDDERDQISLIVSLAQKIVLLNVFRKYVDATWSNFNFYSLLRLQTKLQYPEIFFNLFVINSSETILHLFYSCLNTQFNIAAIFQKPLNAIFIFRTFVQRELFLFLDNLL